MADANLDAELLMDMLSQVLGTIYGTMLTASTAKTEHQRCEATLDITAHMGISQFIYRVEESQDFPIVFKESDDGLVKARQLFIGLVASGIVC